MLLFGFLYFLGTFSSTPDFCSHLLLVSHNERVFLYNNDYDDDDDYDIVITVINEDVCLCYYRDDKGPTLFADFLYYCIILYYILSYYIV